MHKPTLANTIEYQLIWDIWSTVFLSSLYESSLASNENIGVWIEQKSEWQYDCVKFFFNVLKTFFLSRRKLYQWLG